MTVCNTTARRRWRSLQVALVVLLAGATGRNAHAQALPTASGPGSYVIVGGTFSQFQGDYGQQTISGGSAYVDTNLFWNTGIETEARRMWYPNFRSREETLMTGPRWSLRRTGLVPYAKVLVGGGRFVFPYGYGVGNYFAIAPGAGVDLRIGRRLRFRLIDFEYQEWPGFTYGALHPYGISAGVSFQVLGSQRTKLSK